MPVNSLDTTYGALFIGLIASAVLYGITLLQTYLYWRNYADDARFIRLLVVVLVILDTSHLILCTIALYTYLITDFAKPEALGRGIWSIIIQTDFNGLIGLAVECFFARRVWILSRNIVLVGVIVILACVHFGFGVFFSVAEFKLVEISKLPQLAWSTPIGLGSAAAADIMIAVSLCYYLLKSRSGYSRTDSIIYSVIGYSLTTGLVTSILALTCVITFALMPTNLINLAVFWLMGRCYVNSFLAFLNSRESLREKAQLEGPFLHMSPFRVSQSIRVPDSEAGLSIINPGKLEQRETNRQALAVNVEMQTVRKVDFY